VGQVIVKFWREFPCPVWQDISVLMFCGFSGSNESKVRGERVDETYDTTKSRVIVGGFQEENIRRVRLSAEITMGSFPSLKPDCAGGYTGNEFTLKSLV